MPLMSFDQAIEDSNRYSKRHLLLGNGFSIACFPKIFTYASLFSQADFSRAPEVENVFRVLKTEDFEAVIKALETSSTVLPSYVPTGIEAAKLMAKHAAALKDILVETIAANHPSLPSDIPDEKFWACRKFLSHFLMGKIAGQVFSLNYDLLLYWTLMHEDMPFGDPLSLQINDGFGNAEDDPHADFVVWQGETGAHSASVHFLHGALHLFDSGADLQKYTWVRKGEPLIVQARAAMDRGAFPLFVAEGLSTQKKNKIRHNAYLYQGLKQLTSNAQQGKHCFFIFGHSLNDSDGHILTRLGRGRFAELYVGIYGNSDTPDNKRIMASANKLSALRHEDRFPLSVSFFDAQTAKVWG